MKDDLEIWLESYNEITPSHHNHICEWWSLLKGKAANLPLPMAEVSEPEVDSEYKTFSFVWSYTDCILEFEINSEGVGWYFFKDHKSKLSQSEFVYLNNPKESFVECLRKVIRA